MIKFWGSGKMRAIGKKNFYEQHNLQVNISKAKKFRDTAKKCTCTFECANAINTVYDPKHWISLI